MNDVLEQPQDEVAEQSSEAADVDANQTHEKGRQGELPFAMVEGKPYTQLPEDLYIPPHALEVILDAFEGPLDLLLYLIKRQNLDIVDIPIAKITQQYINYIEVMESLRLELAAEYLVMAAMLAEIKSRMLLPKTPFEEEDEGDPRTELIRRLQEYERYKTAAEAVDELPRRERDVFWSSVQPPDMKLERPQPDITLKELMLAFQAVMKRAQVNASHTIEREVLSIRERMTTILSKLTAERFVKFENCFSFDEGKMGVVVSFIAILELVKQSMIQIVQTDPYQPIHLKVAE